MLLVINVDRIFLLQIDPKVAFPRRAHPKVSVLNISSLA